MSPSTTQPERDVPVLRGPHGPRSTGTWLLPVLVFVVGAASLGAEIAAARLLAPYFGASTIVWANTIGVVLVALSVGYWFGGRYADRHPHLRRLCLLILVAALLIAAVPFASRPFLDFSVDAFDTVSVGGFVGSLFGVLVLVAVPVTLLGAVAQTVHSDVPVRELPGLAAILDEVDRDEMVSVVIRHPLVRPVSTRYGASQAADLPAIRAMAAALFSAPGAPPTGWSPPS